MSTFYFAGHTVIYGGFVPLKKPQKLRQTLSYNTHSAKLFRTINMTAVLPQRFRRPFLKNAVGSRISKGSEYYKILKTT